MRNKIFEHDYAQFTLESGYLHFTTFLFFRNVNEKDTDMTTTNNDDSKNISKEVHGYEAKSSITKEESAEKEVAQRSKTLTKVKGLRRSVSFSGKSHCYNY